MPQASPYSFLMAVGIAVTLYFWTRLAKRDHRLFVIYLAGLGGAFIGAKIVYLAAEGWLYWNDPHRWLIWATGKTILGAFLGGYPAVEVAKKITGYQKATGDFFALVAPVGIVIGRIGCLLHGCCLGRECAPAWYTMRDRFGIDRWPAVPVEMAFNVAALGMIVVMRRLRFLPGQHFHLYLIGYGLFRYFHEWMRDTPRIARGYSGYQIAALLVVVLGVIGFIRRAKGSRGCERHDSAALASVMEAGSVSA